jgi:signal transduction histidine kinase/DNA-binding NarL/FixJ family response regulator
MITSSQIRHYRILSIDNNASVNQDICNIFSSIQGDLQSLGMESTTSGAENRPIPPDRFDIDCAFKGEEGLALVRQALEENRPYALAFIEGHTALEGDRIETIEQIWRADPEVQIVICATQGDDYWQKIWNAIGESDRLMICKKPFDKIEILQLTRTLSRKWELNRKLQDQVDSLSELAKRSSEEKKRVSTLLETAINHSPTGILISSAMDGKILWANPASMSIIDLNSKPTSPDKTSNNTGRWEFFRSDGSPYPPTELPLSRALLQGQVTRDEEFIIRDPQSRNKWISANAAPIRDAEGEIFAGIFLFQDITERKQSEKEREKLQSQLNHAQKMESIGRLAGGVAHDFNNLLQVIAGNIELLQMGMPPQVPGAKRVRTILESISRASQLVSQLLLFGRKAEIRRQPLNLNQEVRETVAMLERTIPKMIKIETRLSGDLWPIHADPVQTEQILLNLGSNAADAMVTGGKLLIETSNIILDEQYALENVEILPGKYVLMIVSDTGCGMNKETLDHIFDPFFTTKEIGRGTGLGLSSVYGIVKAHGGFIQCSSELGKGATFKIYWPAMVKVDLDQSLDSTGDSTLKGGTETILIVDDDEGVRELAKDMLQLHGYTAVLAGSGEEAISLYTQHQEVVRLVLLDLNMPGMGGRQCLKELLDLDPQASILISSGYSTTVNASDAIKCGARGYIGKPYRLTDLLTKVRRILDGGSESIEP